MHTFFSKIIFIELISCLFFCACLNEGTVYNKQDTLSYNRTSFNLFLDNLTPFGNGMLLGEVNQDNLILCNQINKSIDFYSINTGNLVRRIDLKRNEEFSKLHLSGFKILDKYKILVVFKYFLNKATLINHNGDIIEKIYIRDNGDKGLINSVVSLYNPIVVNEDSIWQISSWPWGEEPKSSFYNIYIYNYNLITKNLSQFILPYPEDLMSIVDKSKKDFLAITVHKCINSENNIIISFPRSNYLGLMENVGSDSVYFVEIGNNSLSFEHRYMNGLTPMQYLLEYAHSSHILYDSLNDLYIRMINLPTHRSKETKFKDNTGIQLMSIAIQIIDNKYKEIGVVYLEDSKYDIYRSFVLNGKLYISKSNLNNKNINENIINFDVFDFEYKYY